MLVAIVADTHLPRGRRRLPDACLEQLRRADLILHAGDFVSAGALAELEDLGPPIAAVHGNVDSEDVQQRLPETRVVEVAGARIGMVHDAGPARARLGRMRRRFPDAAALVFGHSHIPLHEEDEDGFQIFNPGSPTDRRRQPRHTMGLARVEDSGLRFEHVVLD
jgi:putative phosphoesterase